jgi:hypothetical protein
VYLLPDCLSEARGARSWKVKADGLAYRSIVPVRRILSAAASHHRGALQRSAGTRYIDVNRNDAVAAAYDRIRIVIITAAVGARPHGDDVARLRHLVVDLASRPALFCW